MDIRVILGMLLGCALGGTFVCWCFRRGLDEVDLKYLMSFRQALRKKNYEEYGKDEEGGDEDGEQD